MSIDRTDLVKESFEKKAVPVEVPAGKTSDYYGELVFDRAKMCKYLDADTLKALLECIDKGVALDRKTADGVAKGMKEWAMEHNVTHITHWFQPLTEGTAEKHDSLIDYDGKGGVIETFDGKSLAQQEPDASSFPSGGIRATFEARGYTAWDPTSPVFIQGDTLCIPTVFISYTGEALDYKTPLKKALKAVSDAAVPVCRLFDPSVNKVYSYLGWEQEYFLVDESLYSARPDLMITGRTLMGHNSSKNQQLDDHYFGAIPSRVAAFMRDLEIEGHRLGIPLKTRHNEVAPNQFELAPIFGETNLSNDQNQIIMNLMNKLARKHGFVVLFHEKPFDGVNGSGKHNNWSLAYGSQNLLDPGTDPHQNAIFLTVLTAIIEAIDLHSDMLRASVTGAGNDHRLGANEAPPAIISMYLGDQLADVIEQLEKGAATSCRQAGTMKIGVDTLPPLPRDATDRNRTSPFAFTGNKFEFRAPGSSQSCAGANVVINTIVAQALDKISDELEKFPKKNFNEKLQVLLQKIIKAHKRVIFNGDGYTEAWKKEAAKRGLPNAATTPEALGAFVSEKSKALFTKYSVFTEAELESRYEIFMEEYAKKIRIEGELCLSMSRTIVQPAAGKQVAELAQALVNMKAAGLTAGVAAKKEAATVIGKLLDSVTKKCNDLEAALKTGNQAPVIKAMAALRTDIDQLELLIDDEIWPLPKYREMLFIS